MKTKEVLRAEMAEVLLRALEKVDRKAEAEKALNEKVDGYVEMLVKYVVVGVIIYIMAMVLMRCISGF